MSERQEQWEARYASVDRLWSGEPNDWLPELAADWTPGTALDIGCGEGDDALWLAARGWDVTGADLSPTAVGRLRDGARRAGLDGRVRALVLDVTAEPLPAGPFDLVTSFYVHGGPAAPRPIRLMGGPRIPTRGGKRRPARIFHPSPRPPSPAPDRIDAVSRDLIAEDGG